MSSCAALSWRHCGGAALVIAFLVVTVLLGRPASAETLEEALADAYLINPVLNAERARLRATDEQVALAKSGLRPFIFGSADTSFLNTNTSIDGRRQSSPFSVLATPGQCSIDPGGAIRFSVGPNLYCILSCPGNHRLSTHPVPVVGALHNRRCCNQYICVAY